MQGAQNPNPNADAQETEAIFEKVKEDNLQTLNDYIAAGKSLSISKQEGKPSEKYGPFLTLIEQAATHGSHKCLEELLKPQRLREVLGPPTSDERCQSLKDDALRLAIQNQYSHLGPLGQTLKPKGPGTRHYQTAKLLLENKANPNNKVAGSPLITAASQDDTAMLGLLLQHGIDVDQRGGANMTAIMYAAMNGSFSNVKLLVNAGANIDLADDSRKTALMYASERGHIGAVNLLVWVGADIDLEDSGFKTAYTLALEANKPEIANYLEKMREQFNSLEAAIGTAQGLANIEDLRAFSMNIKRELSEAIRRNKEDQNKRLEEAKIASLGGGFVEYYQSLQKTLNEALQAIFIIHSGFVRNNASTTSQSAIRTAMQIAGYAAGFFPFAASVAPIVNDLIVEPLISLNWTRKINRANRLIPDGNLVTLTETNNLIARILTLSFSFTDNLTHKAELMNDPAIVDYYHRFGNWLTDNEQSSNYQKLGISHALIIIALVMEGKFSPASIKSPETLLPIFNPGVSVQDFKQHRENILNNPTSTMAAGNQLAPSYFSAAEELAYSDFKNDVQTISNQAINLAFGNSNDFLFRYSDLKMKAQKLSDQGFSVREQVQQLDALFSEIYMPVVRFKAYNWTFDTASSIIYRHVQASAPNIAVVEKSGWFNCCCAVSIQSGLRGWSLFEPSQVSGVSLIDYMKKQGWLNYDGNGLKFVQDSLSAP
ncbi:MAG: ankyrin repeat domain protein [Gammaproteobacteria bacterium]|nr:ankyrin repeat domain protein [Gammaproteobacteria bacterium]